MRMADIVSDQPDPTDAAEDPAGFAKSSFAWMATAGVAVGLLKLGNRVIAEPGVDMVVNYTNKIASSAGEQADDGPEIF